MAGTIEEPITRRKFLDYIVKASGAFVATVVAIPVIGYIISPAFTKKEAAWIQVGTTSDFPVGQPKLVQFTAFKKDGWFEETVKRSVWVINKGEGQLTIFNPRCTHLGCAVNWEANEKRFRSPCHNGIFDIGGRVLSGPPPRSLDTLPVRIEGPIVSTIYKDFRLGVPEKVEL